MVSGGNAPQQQQWAVSALPYVEPSDGLIPPPKLHFDGSFSVYIPAKCRVWSKAASLTLILKANWNDVTGWLMMGSIRRA